MSDEKTGGPAFPVQEAYAMSTEQGMTLRDYFAAKAMLALLTSPLDDMNYRARRAYAMADEMLKARNK